ncbi:MAG TPA: hypothetical protein VN822_12605 [Candidatus Acidoferrales bacterium]|nr:hypothetical protein [Candidatus Acidoferrales bacterium]
MKRLALVVSLGCFLGIPLPFFAQTKDQPVDSGIGGINYPCNGMVKRLPADLLGREYRGQCIEGIEVWSWADKMPAHFGPAESTVFIIVVNRRNETASVVRDDFYMVSVDPKHSQDANRAKVSQAIDPLKIANQLTRLGTPSYSEPPPKEVYSNIYNSQGQYVGKIVSTDPLWPLVNALREQQQRQSNEQNAQATSTMATWIVQTAYTGGAISPGGYLSGYLYLGKTNGINSMLMYGPKAWVDRDKYIQIPLGNWPIETGLAPQ